ncbi:hypothetical protein [Tenacibaculum aquimarinum]|uniref:hypothetical protein n=1 Tax=Tenacibaculum aquimarinum TaxID=2910675 RepID=UPI001F0B46F4|nr:hypothetical protein [Tenacibaculum aquimarinum]MCH3885561.1 hypothetical protein [Tenacibaculum aquimarinum]
MGLFLMILAAVVVAFLLAFVIVKFVPLKMRWLVSLLLLALTIFLGFKIYEGIMKPIKFAKEKQVRYAKVITNLKMVRDAEVKYNEVYGTFTKDKNALITFIENGKLAITQTNNVEKDVRVGSGISVKKSFRVVDTIGFEPVLKSFEGKDYKNMFKVPGTDKEFSLEVGKVEKIAGLEVPAFIAKIDKASILKGMDVSLVKQELEANTIDQIKGEFVTVGSLEEVTTGGNWPPAYDKGSAEKK